MIVVVVTLTNMSTTVPGDGRIQYDGDSDTLCGCTFVRVTG